MTLGTWLHHRPEREQLGANGYIIYTIKPNPNRFVARLKAMLMAKRFSQLYGLGYVVTFSLVGKMITVRMLIPLATTYQ